LPWHRQLLLKLENELRSINQTVFIPYWDQSQDSDSPENSIIFKRSRAGGSNPLNKELEAGCITGGSFASMKSQIDIIQCIKRGFSKDGYISPFEMEYLSPSWNVKKGSAGKADKIRFFKQSEIEQVLLEPDFPEFSNMVEHKIAPAAQFFCASKNGTLTQDIAPFDPIFWIHMA
jgi:hypothetical protein